MGGGGARRYTSGMKIAALLSRHWRLLVLCGLSACAHLLLLELAARRTPAAPPRPVLREAIALRLAPPPSPAVAAPPPRAAAGAPQDTVRPRARAAVPQPPSVVAPRAGSTQTAVAAVAGPPLMSANPGAYRADLPPPARLAYRWRDGAGGDGPAYLDWRRDGGGYRLELDGILGRLSSQGLSGDTGMEPARASETRAGREEAIGFDTRTGTIAFEASGASTPATLGVQDRASVLVQLAAIGRAAPGQFPDTVRIPVAGADAVRVEEYQLLGKESVDTGIGTLAAWHLAQLTAPGQPRLELWLAPTQDWLPVQLRLTRADGSVSTQVLASAERAAAQP